MLGLDAEHALAALIVGVAVGVVSLTVTRSLIFKPIREWFDERNEFLADLFGCPYCFSHWVSAVFSVLFLEVEGIREWVVWTLFLTAIGSLTAGAVYRILKGDEA